MKRDTQTTRGLLRNPRARLITALVAGITLLAGAVTFAQVSAAQDRPSPGSSFDPSRFPALAAAARIPNDQGPSRECTPVPTKTPPAPATTTPTTTAPAPTTNPVTDPAADPPADAGASDAGVDKALAAADALHHRGGGKPSPACHADLGGPVAADYIDIRQVAPNARSAAATQAGSAGTFEAVCGRNDNNHFNSDNFIVAPGVTNGAHHVHEYVGNTSTNGLSNDTSLAASGTTCRRSDQSTYFWPALRQRGTVAGDQNADGGGKDGNVGRIIRPSAVRLGFRGNTTAKVVAMPRFVKIITGDAKATTNGPANAKAQWTCTGFTNRLTTKYPLCPRGSQVQRILNFPSCWDGVNIDSANHRAHVVFPTQSGACPEGTRAIPQLRMTLTYSVPGGRSFSLDSFPEQLHNPLTDHADFANLMPDSLMSTVVDCVNRGRRC